MSSPGLLVVIELRACITPVDNVRQRFGPKRTLDAFARRLPSGQRQQVWATAQTQTLRQDAPPALDM
eukprot:11092062-Alexandrium_andersonii.AAC.1